MVRLYARFFLLFYIVLKIPGRSERCCYLDLSCHFVIHITQIPSMANLTSHSNTPAEDILRPARQMKSFTSCPKTQRLA